MYLSDGENEAPPPPLPDPSGGSMRTSSRVVGGKSPLLLKLKKGAIGNSTSTSSRGRSAMKQSSPGSSSTPTSATQRAAARKASGTRRRSSSRTRSASVDPSGRIATASYVRQSATASSSVGTSISSTTSSNSKSGRRPSSSSAGIQASSSRSIGSNGSGSNSSVRSTSRSSSSRSKTRRSSSSPATAAPPARPSASSRKTGPTNDAIAATSSVAARGSDPPGPVAAVTRRSGGRGQSASSPGKERIKKRAERERQRQLSLEERRVVEAVQQQKVVAAVAASLMGTPPRAATATATTTAGATGGTSSAPKYVNQSPELARKPPAIAGSSPVFVSSASGKKTPSPAPKYVNQSPELARREESSSPVDSAGEKEAIDVDAVADSPYQPSTIGDNVKAEVDISSTNSRTKDIVEATTSDDNIEATDIVVGDDNIARSNEASPRMKEPNDATQPMPSNMTKEETPKGAEEEDVEKREAVAKADNGADVNETAHGVPTNANRDGSDYAKAIDNDDDKHIPEEKENVSANDNIGHDNNHHDEEPAGMKDSTQTAKNNGVDEKEAIAAALSLLNASASGESDLGKGKLFESAEEGIPTEVAVTAETNAAPVKLENGWTGTVTLRASPTPDSEDNDVSLPSAVTESKIKGKEIKSKVTDEAIDTNTDDVAGAITIATETMLDDNVTITNIEGTADNNQEKLECNDEGEKPPGSTENNSFDSPSDSVDGSVPEPASSAGIKRKDGASEDGDIIVTPRRKKMSGLRVDVGDSINDSMAEHPNSNVSALASPSASELIEHFEAKSPKAGSHGFVPPSPRSSANKGALSPPREPFRFGAPPSKAPSNQLVVKTPPRHPPSRGSSPGSHATYDYPQRVQSPKWANSLSQSIAKGVCETQQSPRSNNDNSGDTERILLEMKKMELRMEARMLHMEQHLEKQMRSKFKYLEARMDERMDEIQASLQILLARDITEI